MCKFVFLSLSCLFIHSLAFTQDGALDNAFGTNGTITLDNAGGNAEFLDIAATGDNFTAVGFSTIDGTETITAVQFDEDGTINTAFATSGQLTIPLGGGNGRASAITVQDDGKILMAGWARISNGDDFVIVRFMPDGTLDSSFGDNGVLVGDIGSSNFAEDEIADIELLADGRIVVAGRGYNGADEDAFIACFNSDGSFDTTFGTEGIVILDFGNSPPFELATALVIDDQDRIVVGGQITLDFFDEDSFFVTRMDDTGAIDNTFGDNGSLIYTLASNITAGLNTLAIDNEGSIITGGGAFDTDELDNNFFLTRINTDGTIDASFGDNGQTILQRNSNEAIFDLEVLSSGDIIAAGSTGGFPSRFALVRFNDAGQQDFSFGTNGWATTQIESGFNAIRGIVFKDSRIYAAGTGYDNTNWKMALAKYVNEGVSSSTKSQLSSISNMEVFPNPASTNITVRFTLETSQLVKGEIRDARGQVIQELFPWQEYMTGEYKWHAYVDRLPTGTYFLTILGGNETNTTLFQVIAQ